MNPRERQPHLSRAERRAQQRQAAKQGAKNKTPYIISAALGLGALAAGVLYSKSQEPSIKPTPPPYTTPVNPDFSNLPDEVVIKLDTDRRNIHPDLEEQNLWEIRVKPPLPIDKEEIFKEVVEKIDQTLDKMSKSKIKQLRDDAAYIRSMIATGKMSFLPIYEESLKGTFEAGSHMTTMFRVTPDKTDTTIYLRVALEKTLEQNFLANAIALSHEAFHIRILEKEQTKMKQAGLSATEQLQKAQTETYEDSVKEEAEAYAYATKSYIHAWGLTGGKEPSPTNNRLAAQLIRVNYDTTKPSWRNYVIQLTPGAR